MKRALYVLVFLCLVSEGRSAFVDGHWVTPLRYVTIALFETRLGLPLFDWLVLGLIIASPGRIDLHNPMLRAIAAAIAALGITALHGALRSGSVYHMQFQLHPLLAGFALAIALCKLLRTPEDYVVLGKWLVAAACWRAFSCAAFYVLEVLPGSLAHVGELHAITAHEDSVTFSNGICAVSAFALMRPSRRHLAAAIGVSALLLLGIVLNNRRLAWVDLACSLAAVYAGLPASPTRRVLTRVSMWLLPLALVYGLIGWGRPEPVWKPVRALQGMSSSTDLSTLSRTYENEGLLVTARENPLWGLGFGRRYIETNDTLAAHGFTQYRYLPHNSVLGTLAFGGLLGFAGIWVIFPVAAFLAFRTSLHTREETLRLLSLGVLATLVSYMLQMYGDMGLIGLVPCAQLGCGLACAALLAERARNAD